MNLKLLVISVGTFFALCTFLGPAQGTVQGQGPMLPSGQPSYGGNPNAVNGYPTGGYPNNTIPGSMGYGNGAAGNEPAFRVADAGTGSAPLIPASSSVASDTNSADGSSAEVETGATGGFIDRWNSGGPLMYPLAICSLVVIALAIERLLALRRSRIIPRPFVRRFTECVQDGQLSHDEALEICDEFSCPVAEVFHAAVKRWGRPTVEVEQAVMDAGERIADGLRRYLRLFHAISNVSPLLGLLGTVLGMIEAFDSLTINSGDAPPEMLASGISEALITTAAGLSVAIPAYLAYIFFSAKADRYLIEIDSLCQQVVDSISAEGLSGGSNSRSTNRRTKRAA